jgi:hypothetical protein
MRLTFLLAVCCSLHLKPNHDAEFTGTTDQEVLCARDQKPHTLQYGVCK